jgi:hypothetical protein
MVRLILVISFLSIAAVGITATFWRQELRYQLPTPVPANYQSVALGQAIILPDNFLKGTAYFLHFYNPDCPCSRFNSKNVKSLIRHYGDSVKMVIVVPNPESAKQAKLEFENCDMYVDENNLVAQAAAVYATPQAVIVDQRHTLYYKGNYNKSRYCTAQASNFAELSLVALLQRQPPPQFGLLATQAYGCEWGKINDSIIELF